MDRLWQVSLIIGLPLLAMWQLPKVGVLPALEPPLDILPVIGLVGVLAFAMFAFIVRNMGYIQAQADYIRLVTPFLNLRISYQRVRSVRPSNVAQVFPPGQLRGTQRRFLEPFFGKTAVLLELKGYPVSTFFLKLFLVRSMFLPQGTGFVLVVPDWMALSTEIDSHQGVWRGKQKKGADSASGAYGILQSLRKK